MLSFTFSGGPPSTSPAAAAAVGVPFTVDTVVPNVALEVTARAAEGAGAGAGVAGVAFCWSAVPDAVVAVAVADDVAVAAGVGGGSPFAPPVVGRFTHVIQHTAVVVKQNTSAKQFVTHFSLACMALRRQTKTLKNRQHEAYSSTQDANFNQQNPSTGPVVVFFIRAVDTPTTQVQIHVR